MVTLIPFVPAIDTAADLHFSAMKEILDKECLDFAS
jgi:hypothetical protein